MPILSRKKRVWLLLIGLAIFSWIAQNAYRSLSQQRADQASAPMQPMLMKGMTLPKDFKLEELGANKTELSSLDGKVLLINFWAGWCGPCLHEMPGLYELHQHFSDKGFAVVGVNMDDDSQGGMKVLKSRVGEAPFPMYRGVGSSIADRFDIEGLPFTVIVDRQRKIHYVRAGEVDWKGAEASKLIEGLL